MSQSTHTTIRERRPDDCLPTQLRDDRIIEVRDMSSWSHQAYQIVFDESWLPYGYWNPPPDGWRLTYARTEWHRDDGFLGMLRGKRARICIVVSQPREEWNKPFGPQKEDN